MSASDSLFGIRALFVAGVERIFRNRVDFRGGYWLITDSIDSAKRAITAIELDTVALVMALGITGVDFSAQPHVFGGGADGNLSAGFGDIVLTGPTYYGTVTLGAGDSIDRAGFPLYIQHLVSNVAGIEGAIFDSVNNGGNGVQGSSAGNDGGAALTATAWSGSSGAGGGGGDPTTSTPNNGGTPASITRAMGGTGGNGGVGGSGGGGGTGSGGVGQAGGTSTRFLTLVEKLYYASAANTISQANGGGGGGGGCSGSGSGAGHQSGAGGGGGGGARPAFLRIGKITTSALTPAGVVTCRGGNGGNGAASQAVNNTGGGGGGAGGGGGYLHCVVGDVVGPAVVGFFSCAGGTGGNGAAGNGTGTAGAAGAGGGGGNIDLIQLHLNTATHTTGAAAVGAAAGVCSADLAA